MHDILHDALYDIVHNILYDIVHRAVQGIVHGVVHGVLVSCMTLCMIRKSYRFTCRVIRPTLQDPAGWVRICYRSCRIFFTRDPCVREVTATSEAVFGQNRRDGFVITRLSHREKTGGGVKGQKEYAMTGT